MDLHMPAGGGIEAAAQIRADAGDEAAPILVVTADVLVPDDASQQAGFCGVLRVPVSLSALIAAVERCLAEQPRGADWIHFPSYSE